MRWPLVLLAACDSVLGLGAVHVDAPTATGWQALDTGTYHTCAIRRDGTLWCWGSNAVGQLGIGSLAPQIEMPAQVTGTWTQIATAYSHTCGLQTDRSLWCW